MTQRALMPWRNVINTVSTYKVRCTVWIIKGTNTARQAYVSSHKKRMLEEILVRVRALQDAVDENEVKDLLRNPRYRKALREAESDINSVENAHSRVS